MDISLYVQSFSPFYFGLFSFHHRTKEPNESGLQSGAGSAWTHLLTRDLFRLVQASSSVNQEDETITLSTNG